MFLCALYLPFLRDPAFGKILNRLKFRLFVKMVYGFVTITQVSRKLSTRTTWTNIRQMVPWNKLDD